jgi:peptide/nickel transport system permease protein
MTTTTNTPNLGAAGENILALGEDAPSRGVSNFQRSLNRLRKHRMAMLGAGILIGLLAWIIVWSFIIPEPISRFNNPANKLQAPSSDHWFGTDQIGRDLFARSIYGGQISLFIGVTAVIVQITIGTLVGLLAGYMGGVVDALLMRIAEAMLSIPQLFLALIAVRIFAGQMPDFRLFGRDFSSTLIVMILVIGLTSWMRMSRIVRSVVLSIKEQEFITAARSLGVPTHRILLQHVLPNCIAPIIVSATLGVASAILLEAYLGFLGFGVRAPTPTWGNIIGDAYRSMLEGHWYFWFFPAVYIVLTVLGINFLGDGLRDAFDPRSLK